MFAQVLFPTIEDDIVNLYVYIYPNVTLIDDDFVTSKFLYGGNFVLAGHHCTQSNKTSEEILTDGNNQDPFKFVQRITL